MEAIIKEREAISNEAVMDIAVNSYTGEICRVCGLEITESHLKAKEVVMCGSLDALAHKSCFYSDIPVDDWKYPVNAF